jgi:hypothetical protein
MKSSNWIFFLFLLFSTVANGQSLRLDARAGFGDFQLGDNVAKWQRQITFERESSSSRLRTARYTGYCCQSVLGFSVDEIYLKFLNNSLVEIEIHTRKNVVKVGEYYDGVTEIYGKPDAAGDSSEFDFIWQWQRRAAVLTLKEKYGSTLSGSQRAVYKITDIRVLK